VAIAEMSLTVCRSISRIPAKGHAGYNPGMSENRNKPGLAFWATLIVVIAVAYPLSFGPSCWLASRFDEPHPIFEMCYRPLGWLANRTRPHSWNILYPFATWGMTESGLLYLRAGAGEAPTLIMRWDDQHILFCPDPEPKM
jgi:hypothetical protein